MNSSPVLGTLADLVRINSVNPEWEGGRPESEIDEFIADFLRTHGIESRLQEVLPGRPNLIAVLPGRSSHRRIMFEAHADTVSVNGMSIPPFEPTVSDGRMYGRGSCDTKAGLAAMMHAFVSLKGAPPPCEVWLVASADEEHAFRGVVKLLDGLPPIAAAVIAEPTDLRVVVATKGLVRFRVICRGKAAHSSKPHLGVNAISHMTHVIRAIEADAAERTGQRHPLLGPPTSNVGLIKGGVQVNFVPDGCVIEVDRRLIPGEDPAAVLADYRRLVDGLRATIASFDAVIEPTLADTPLETSPGAPIATLASAVVRDAGRPGEAVGVPYGSDASKLAHAGISSIVLGPGSIDQAHSAVEYVECAQVLQAEEIYRRMMREFE